MQRDPVLDRESGRTLLPFGNEQLNRSFKAPRSETELASGASFETKLVTRIKRSTSSGGSGGVNNRNTVVQL